MEIIIQQHLDNKKRPQRDSMSRMPFISAYINRLIAKPIL